MQKWMWLIAGPNGAGKSSFASKFLVVLGYADLIRFNADDQAKRLRMDFPKLAANDINLMAVKKVDADVVNAINDGKSFYIDTVLSTPKYRDDVLASKELGYRNGLVYVSLYPPELSPERIKLRVAKGGHGVDPVKAVERYYRSHNELRWFAPHMDIFTIHDNSRYGEKPIMIAAKWAGHELVHYNPGINPVVDQAVLDIKKTLALKNIL